MADKEYTVYIKSFYTVFAPSESEAEDKALEALSMDIEKGAVNTQIVEES